MFANKTNGAAPGAMPAVPSGLQMLLKSMGFDPAAFLSSIAGMMQEITAARTEFQARLEGLRVGLGGSVQAQLTQHDAIKAAMQEQNARLDAVIAQMTDNNRRTAEALEEILQCLKKQRQRK